MSRITVDTKCRLCRAEGDKLYLKGSRCLSGKCPIEKKGAVVPGMHGLKRRSKPTDYGIQLRAKQKAKRIYGVNETQFKNYYVSAKTLRGLVGDNLLTLLERRFDNALYLSGLALSRSHARQLISHDHVLVNGKPLNINSYSLKIDDVVSLDEISINQLKETLNINDKDFKTPVWLELDKSHFSFKVKSMPQIDSLDSGIDINLIVEFYSR